MGPRGKGVNTKVQAALEKKNANLAAKKAKETQKAEQLEAAEWKKGSNVRKESRMQMQANKADDILRKKREKQELLKQEEEAMMGSSTKIKTVVGSGMKKKQQQQKKKKGNRNDFDLLEESLVSAAEKKSKASKRAERLKKEAEEKKRKEMAMKKSQEEEKLDPLLANTNAMIGSVNDSDITMDGRQANIERGKTSEGSGLDGAIAALSLGSDMPPDQHPEKRMKGLHKAFEEKMMPQMKEDYPGLKMSQYKEKIFNIWKKSPENPMNQQI